MVNTINANVNRFTDGPHLRLGSPFRELPSQNARAFVIRSLFKKMPKHRGEASCRLLSLRPSQEGVWG